MLGDRERIHVVVDDHRHPRGFSDRASEVDRIGPAEQVRAAHKPVLRHGARQGHPNGTWSTPTTQRVSQGSDGRRDGFWSRLVKELNPTA